MKRNDIIDWLRDKLPYAPDHAWKNVMQAAIDALPEQEERRWISVKDRLPQGKGEVCKNVNLLMDDGLVTVGWLNENTGKAYYLDTWNDVINRVPISRCTHWMPLPEPPKEG